MGIPVHRINVSIVFATKGKQWQEELTVARGTSAQELLALSKMAGEIAEQLAELKRSDTGELRMGVFSIPVEPDYLMEEGDRLEIYRPLTADPKEVRRQLALLGKTMGGKS